MKMPPQHTPSLRATPLERGPSAAQREFPSREGCPKGGVCSPEVGAAPIA
jgi:hypothetical protein